jgi:hypothetical protein
MIDDDLYINFQTPADVDKFIATLKRQLLHWEKHYLYESVMDGISLIDKKKFN